jgi:hypothetical protein
MNERHRNGMINLRYSTLRMKRINHLVLEGFSFVQSINIRDFEESQPSHFQPKSWKDRFKK